MKKGLLISFEFPPQPGGIGTYAYQLACYAYKNTVDITALVLSSNISNTEIEKFDKDQPFKIQRFKKYRYYFQNVLHRVFSCFRVVLKNNFDFIYIANYSAGILALFLKLFLKKKFVIMGHGTEFLNPSGIRKLIVKIIYQFADLILVNSTYTNNLLTKRFNVKSKIYITTLGADDKKYFPVEKSEIEFLKKKHGIENKFILLTVGSLSKRKNHSIVINAVNKLKDEIPNIYYLIVGMGPHKVILEKQICSLNLENYIKCVGFVNHNKLNDYYNMSDLFILTSTVDENGQTEGFGIVIVEANLAGKPAIGIKNSGMDDAIENNKSGLLIERDNENEVVKAIKKMFNDKKLCNNISKYALERARAHYTWEKVASKTYNIIKSTFKFND